MTLPGLETLAQAVAGRLLNTAAEGVVLAGLVWLVLRLTARPNSRTRFAIWFAALLAIVALPFFAASGWLAPRTLSGANPHSEITLPGSWALYLFTAWAFVAGLLLLRLCAGLWRVHHIRRNCSAVEISTLDPVVAATLRDFTSRRRATLCVSRDVTVPAAIGFFRPAIVFPEQLLPHLSSEEIRIVLLHELAHFRRWDDWTNLFQKIVQAAFFFHPAVWWIENHLTLEREMACDDVVLAQTASPKAYASSLISFAEKLQSARALALAQALVSRMRHMSLRVTQILDGKRSGRTRLWQPALALSAGTLLLVFGAAPYAPQLVAFQNQTFQNNEVAQTHVRQLQAVSAAAQPKPAAAVLHQSAARAAQPSTLSPQPRAIPAMFTPRPPTAQLRLKTTSARKPMLGRARATQRRTPVRETFVILQTTQFDASGSEVWTLCIWRIGGATSAEQPLPSAIVFSLI